MPFKRLESRLAQLHQERALHSWNREMMWALGDRKAAITWEIFAVVQCGSPKAPVPYPQVTYPCPIFETEVGQEAKRVLFPVFGRGSLRTTFDTWPFFFPSETRWSWTYWTIRAKSLAGTTLCWGGKWTWTSLSHPKHSMEYVICTRLSHHISPPNSLPSPSLQLLASRLAFVSLGGVDVQWSM